MFKDRTVLVTGGTGMIGVQLVRLLLSQGARVRVASLDQPAHIEPGVEFRRGNLTNGWFCRQVVQGVDYVFHLAGIKGSVGIGRSRAATFFVPHLLMNTLMMEAARQAGVERYLFTSSIAVYPPADRFLEDRAWDGSPHPSDKYAAWAKRMGELQAEAYRSEYGWDRVAIVRPANVYGPYDNFDIGSAMVVPALIRRVVEGENPLTVWGDGSAVRDFVFSRDVAEGMLLAIQFGADGVPINLGSGTGVSIRELVSLILECVTNPPRVVWDDSKPGGEPVRLMDVNRAQEKLGFRATTSLREGIRQTVDWYLKSGNSTGWRYNVFREGSFFDP
jgi:GDP-L-fucose synthase